MADTRFEGGHPDPEWLSAWQDGELRGEAADSVRSHLADCPDCRALLARMAMIDRAAVEAAPGYPPGSEWEEIEGRLRQRLEDELGLGIPAEWSDRYVAAREEVVLAPAPSPTSARPFKLRWALMTAAGLGLVIFSMRTLTDRAKVRIPGVTRPTLEANQVPAGAPAPPALEKDESAARVAIDSTEAGKLFAAGERAFDSGHYAAAAQSFGMAAGALSDQDQARDAEFREELSLARKRIDAGESAPLVAERMAREAGRLVALALPTAGEAREERADQMAAKGGAPAEDGATRMKSVARDEPLLAAAPGASDSTATPEALCRHALAVLRAAARLAEETGRGEPIPGTAERIRQLEHCAGPSR